MRSSRRRVSLTVTTAVTATVLGGLLAGTGGAVVAAPVSAAVAGAQRAAVTYPDREAGTDPAVVSGTGGNPFRDRRWGVYQGNGDQSWKPYAAATGETRRVLGAIALRPKAKWFGAWIPDDQIYAKTRDYIANSSGGDPETLVQLSVFRMKPWEHEGCTRLATPAEQASYRTWISRMAAAIGSQRTVIELQPDGPFQLCAPDGGELAARMIRYAVLAFERLPHTDVYIDAGASDWPEGRPDEAVRLLTRAGIRMARGFALSSTHYTSNDDNIAYGTAMVARLSRLGIPGKRFILDTSKNGAPFTWKEKRSSNFDNSPVCRSTTDTRCVSLGVPPTTAVADPRWGLTAANADRARRVVDAYVWFGRPWLYMQADPFLQSRALQLVRTSPYAWSGVVPLG